MKNAKDIANFFIDLAKNDENDTITNLRINKLLYFAQGWFLARYGRPLFEEEIEAWDYGPVVPSIYYEYRKWNKNNIDSVSENYTSDMLDEDELNTLIDVFSYYGRYSTSELVNITHEEDSPWTKIYAEGVNNIISKDFIKEYFQSNPKMKLISFSLPKWMYENAQTGYKTEDGILVFHGNDDDDNE